MVRSKFRSVLVVAGFVGLNACGGGPADDADPLGSTGAAVIGIGYSHPVIESGGLDRPIIVYVPTGYDGHKPLPLVMVLHGFGGSAASMVASTKMSDKAESEGFIVAYLNGTKCDASFGDPGCQLGNEKMGWNSGTTPSLGIDVDDVQFVRDVVSTLQGELRIDARRLYAAGFSNGGFMTHRLAAELPDRLAAVAVAEGTIGLDVAGDGAFDMVPDATGSIPILVMHGTSDATIPYDGIKGGVHVCKSAAESVEFWLAANRCHGSSTNTTTGAVTRASYGGCHANSDVELLTIAGGTHQWPAIGTNAAWSFFSKHSLTKH